MRFLEYVSAQDVKLKFAYHDELNPKLWDGDKLKPEVAKHLLELSELFEEFLKLPDLKVVDRIFTGSNANYNWTSLSDIDLHLVIDISELKEFDADLIAEYLTAKKKVFNDQHDITVYGYDVEFYAQDADEPLIATGVYSLDSEEWVRKPEHEEPHPNNDDIRVKSAELMNRIDDVADGDCDSLDEIEKLKAKIKKMRKAGLAEAGEFSTENLVFKTLRNDGYLEKLDDAKQKAVDSCWSLE